MTDKVTWRGRIETVQPRIRLTRSFDQVSHTYLGYALRVEGTVGDEQRGFWVGVGKVAHEKHRLEVGLIVKGECYPIADPRLETVEFYKVSKLTVEDRVAPKNGQPPPWLGVPPDLPKYRSRGHRRLDAKIYEAKCLACMWGSRMAVEMIIDHWNPSQRRYRTETFCYGPKNCPCYKAGPKRRVPGRRGMTHVEEDWVDQNATAHRQDDE